MKYFLFFPFLSLFHGLYGQVEILNNALLDPSFPVAYRGYSNKIVVKEFENDTTIIVIAHNDTLQRVGDYFYYEGSKLKQDTLIAIKERKIIAQKVYTIERLQEPKVFLGQIRDSIVTINEILNNSELVVSYEPQIAVPCTRVLNFDGKIIKRSGREIPLIKNNQKTENWSAKKWERKYNRVERKGGTIYNGMNFFNTYQTKLIRRMKSGEILYIQYGTLSCPSCIQRKIGINLRFRIK